MAFTLSFSEQILLLLGQDPLVSHYAYEYIKTTFLAIYFQAMFDLQKKFLNAMEVS